MVETNGLEHQIENNDILIKFFSKENIKLLQKLIKKNIYYLTEKKFILDTDQDENDLIVAMRAVYLHESENLPNNFDMQINKLNKHVLQYIIPDMIVQIKQEYSYLKEINEPINPIPLPINVNNGKNSLPSLTSVWN